MTQREIKFRYRFNQKYGNETMLLTRIYTQEEIEYGTAKPNEGVEQILSREQFTGLLDKNGKEIYEGDIVLYPDTESEYVDVGIGEVKVAEREANNFFPVQFNDGEFGIHVNAPDGEVLKHATWYSLCDLVAEVEDLTVIGNIHENLDLLSPSKAEPPKK